MQSGSAVETTVPAGVLMKTTTTTFSGPSLSSVSRPVVDGPEYPGSWTTAASVTVTSGGLTVLHCSHFPVIVSSIDATVFPGGADRLLNPKSPLGGSW